MNWDIFNDKTIRIPLAATSFLAGAAAAYTVILLVYDIGAGGWLQQLLSTLLAAALALIFALYVYLQQVRDEKKRVRDLLRLYLDYLADQVRPEPDPEKVTIKQVNTTLLDEVISSGHVQDVAPRLIILQAFIDRYQKFSDESISLINQNNGSVPGWMKLNIDNSAQIIREEVERCTQIMDGDAYVSSGIQFVLRDRHENEA